MAQWKRISGTGIVGAEQRLVTTPAGGRLEWVGRLRLATLTLISCMADAGEGGDELHFDQARSADNYDLHFRLLRGGNLCWLPVRKVAEARRGTSSEDETARSLDYNEPTTVVTTRYRRHQLLAPMLGRPLDSMPGPLRPA